VNRRILQPSMPLEADDSYAQVSPRLSSLWVAVGGPWRLPQANTMEPTWWFLPPVFATGLATGFDRSYAYLPPEDLRALGQSPEGIPLYRDCLPPAVQVRLCSRTCTL